MTIPPLYIFEDSQVDRLYPLTYARAACELRLGAFTLLERFQRNLNSPIAGLFVRDALAPTLRRRINLPINPGLSTKDGILLINSRLLLLAETLGATPWKVPLPDTAGVTQNTVAWIHLSPELAGKIDPSKLSDPRTLEAILPTIHRQTSNALLINRPWDLFDYQKAAITEDFAALGPANHANLLPGVHLLEAANIHLAKNVKIWPGAVLDAQNGPIIVGENTEIRANAVITGPTSIGPDCIIRTHADIRELCSFGPGSRVGGEISHSIFMGHSSKQHHGFLGQTIVGEWVNIGAGSTTSNLKNTYGTVRMPLSGTDESTGKQFLGAILADHAKIGIGTHLSTGSVVGFASHVILPNPPRFIPSFAWTTRHGIDRADFEKLEQIAAIAMQRRNVEFTPADHDLFVEVASASAAAEKFDWPNS